MTNGVDYSSGTPGGAALQAAGKAFAARYLSRYTAKVITADEATDLHQHGIAIVLVFEDGAERMLGGYDAGHLDAQFARHQADQIGAPADQVIYFAADWDVSPGEMPTVIRYLQGAAGVLGSGSVGVYGGINTVRAALDTANVRYAWQTTAWSYGQWDSRAQLQQRGGNAEIGGVDCDLDDAVTADYGQWVPDGTSTGTGAPAWPGRYIELTDPRMTGQDVGTWQQQMVNRGWNLGNTGPNSDGVDEDFGDLCDKALRAFQAEKGLKEDGILGPISWAATWTAPITP